jgi:hypothetical protein
MDLTKEKPTDITPEMAKEFLDTMRVQRPLNMRRVITYAAMMSRGAWLCYPAIEFNEKGEMINGQHRCEAIILCGLTVPIHVVRGVSNKAQRAMDIGLKRGLNQQLRMYRPNMTHISIRTAGVHVCAYLLSGLPISINNIEEYDRWYAVFKEGMDWAIPTVGIDKVTRTSTIVGGLAFAYRTNPEAISEFGTILASGENLKEGAPAYAMRRILTARAPTGGSQRALAVRKVLNAAEAHCLGDKMLKVSTANHGLEYFREAYAGVKKADAMLTPWLPKTPTEAEES